MTVAMRTRPTSTDAGRPRNPAAAPHVQMRYAVAHSSLGRILVAATERGVSAVMLADHEAELATRLRRDFPGARLERDDRGLADWIGAIVEHVEGLRLDPDVPVDARGSAFQHAVWRALRNIPFGSTRSYREVAEAIGQPSAARAVAQACAANPVALVVPCHRVIRDDGALGGYRWGAERKRRLLDAERAIVAHREWDGEREG